jgi:aldehyde dehydrogenase (NAD+)
MKNETHQKLMTELGLPKPLKHLIDGQLRAAPNKSTTAIDPMTQEPIADIPQATPTEIDDAVAASREAQEQWASTSPGRRRKTLEALIVALKRNEKLHPRIEALDVGMPAAISKQFSSKAMIRNLEYYAEWADKVDGRVVPTGSPNESLDLVMYEPVGVVVGIIPWNTPFLFLGSKTAPALAAGCSVIIKPSELASLPAQVFAEAVVESGMPAGLVQVLFGDGDVGRQLTVHPGVDKVAFTGGTVRGREIMAQASSTLKRVSLELGGKSPHILFEDADVSRATMMAAYGMYSFSGQACAAGSRLFVHQKLAERFLPELVSFIGAMKLGDPLEPETVLGPLISKQHLDRVDAFVQEARSDGAKVLCGGKRSPIGDGNFYEPTVLVDVDPKSRVAREEVFGPVMCVFRFESEEDVIRQANDTVYGLAAGFWTQDISRALRVASKLQAGSVWVNSYGSVPVQAPFGGFKQSGFGRDGGRDGIMEYLQPKNVYIQFS